MLKRTPFGKEAISSTTHKPATNTMYMNANPTAATALWRVITTTYSSPVVSGTIYAVGNCRPLHRKVIGAKGSLTSRLYKKRFPLPKRPLSQQTPPALRATSPIFCYAKHRGGGEYFPTYRVCPSSLPCTVALRGVALAI